MVDIRKDALDDLIAHLIEKNIVFTKDISSYDYKINHQFTIAYDSEKLDCLVNARTDYEIGKALGFPEEASSQFGKVVNGEKICGSYVEVCCAKAVKAKISLPSWLAYINFVPEQLDFIAGKVSPSSEALGKTYQKFMRSNYPEIAQRIECDFKNRKWASDWKIQKDGMYALTFRYDGFEEKMVG